jgi:hypothetical protein
MSLWKYRYNIKKRKRGRNGSSYRLMMERALFGLFGWPLVSRRATCIWVSRKRQNVEHVKKLLEEKGTVRA